MIEIERAPAVPAQIQIEIERSVAATAWKMK